MPYELWHCIRITENLYCHCLNSIDMVLSLQHGAILWTKWYGAPNEVHRFAAYFLCVFVGKFIVLSGNSKCVLHIWVCISVSMSSGCFHGGMWPRSGKRDMAFGFLSCFASMAASFVLGVDHTPSAPVYFILVQWSHYKMQGKKVTVYIQIEMNALKLNVRLKKKHTKKPQQQQTT